MIGLNKILISESIMNLLGKDRNNMTAEDVWLLAGSYYVYDYFDFMCNRLPISLLAGHIFILKKIHTPQLEEIGNIFSI